MGTREKSQGLKTPAVILLGVYLVLVVLKVVADGAMPVSERVGYVTGAMITPAIFYWILALPVRLIRKRWPADPNPLLLVIIGLLVFSQAAQFLTGTAMQTQRSAIDLLVLLEDPPASGRDIDTIVEAIYPLQLELDVPIHALPATASSFERGDFALYRNAQAEGVRI